MGTHFLYGFFVSRMGIQIQRMFLPQQGKVRPHGKDHRNILLQHPGQCRQDVYTAPAGCIGHMKPPEIAVQEKGQRQPVDPVPGQNREIFPSGSVQQGTAIGLGRRGNKGIHRSRLPACVVQMQIPQHHQRRRRTASPTAQSRRQRPLLADAVCGAAGQLHRPEGMREGVFHTICLPFFGKGCLHYTVPPQDCQVRPEIRFSDCKYRVNFMDAVDFGGNLWYNTLDWVPIYI